MDGSERQIIIGENTTWPNGLGLDYETDRLYWVDAGTLALESCTLGGLDRKVGHHRHHHLLSHLISEPHFTSQQDLYQIVLSCIV